MARNRKRRAIADRMIQKTEELCQDSPSFSSSAPRYDLVDDEYKFEVSIDVPGVKREDIDISLEDGYLSIRGERFSPDVKFSQAYSLDESVVVDKITASLDSGVLVVTAPKDVKKSDENVRRIPINTMESSPTTVPQVEAPPAPAKSLNEKQTDATVVDSSVDDEGVNEVTKASTKEDVEAKDEDHEDKSNADAEGEN